MSTHGFDLGTLDLASGLPHGDGYTLSVLGSGATFGQSQAVVRQIVSMLADGDLVSYDRAGNRVAEFDVLIEGADGAALQAGEVALRRELYRPNVVTWTPPADFSAPTVFEVVTSEMAPKFDDIDELRTRRVFHVTLTCAPFARSRDLVTVPALAVGPTPTTVTVSTADSTTGWTTVAPATLGQTGGYVYSTQTSAFFGEGEHYLFFAAATVPATPYVVVEWQATYPTLFTPTLLAAPVVQTLNLPDGWTKTVYDTTGLSYASLTFRAVLRGTSGQYRIRDVKRTDTIPQITARQVARIVSVAGTERTPASLAIKSANGTSNLNMTVVHTSPEDGSGYSPPLRRWRVSGAASPTTDAATMSGAREPILPANPFIAEIPNPALPEGGYLLAARMRASVVGSATINWATDTRIDGVAEGYVTDYATTNFPSSGNWYFVPIAVLTLPSVRSYSGKVRINLSSMTAELDEAWLFRVDDGCALTVLHNAVKPRLWLDSPDVASRVPRIWIGNDAGRVDASHPGANLYTHGNHTFTPDAMAVFVGTSGTENPEASLTYFPRWHSNAAGAE
ncbi:hypothetical protein EUA06_11180 [Nocardioides glacieisoli]|uniref:Uncharacterized protein n=1 Tax=Nocardioides glacieisoli TaxID=1168730 RepID=A0A4Q2RPH9_9ACTN|nr:hypothetical protein [Nocardioides glacieisoli]RYB90831.1 hypothetical protein EUA06_11180 [Nocardioides glacieisoli]